MEKTYEEAVEYFNKGDFVNALKLFSTLDYLNSKEYENKCIDNLEDIIYISKRKKSKKILSELTFYKDFVFFEDAYKRKNMSLIANIIMISCALVATIILLLLIL